MLKLTGTSFDDVLNGTDAAELIEAGWGDDLVEAGGDDDVITDTGGSNIIRAGAGQDLIRITSPSSSFARTNLIEAGDGADIVELTFDGAHTSTIDLGSGDDLLVFYGGARASDVVIRTGEGSDRLVFDRLYGDRIRFGGAQEPVVVKDFTAGDGGDVLDIAGLLGGLLSFAANVASNPLASGHLLLIQDGADVIIRVDRDGFGGSGGSGYWRDVVRLQNVSVNALTTFNLAGYAPDRSQPTPEATNGTENADWIVANAGGGTLSGLGGNDRLIGNVGRDTIDGGAGNDVIEGGFGNDILRGGDGDDVLTDAFGDDVIEGGAGNDVIDIFRPFLSTYTARDTVVIRAGDGDDFVRFELGKGVLFSEVRTATLTIDLGAGNDRLELPLMIPGTQLTLGAGQDRLVLGQQYFARQSNDQAPIVITDFTAGDGGDILELDRAIRGNYWNGLTNPFASGHLQLQQSGADTLVKFYYDGFSSSASNIYTIARLANVSASSLTAFNFSGYAPSGAASSYVIASGTSGDDRLYGSSGADVIDGGEGNDRIEDRKGGADTLIGGAGDDIIIVTHSSLLSSDTITINGGSGNDLVDFYAGVGRLNADLGDGDDRIVLRVLLDGGTFLTLGAGADVVVYGEDTTLGGIRAITINDFAAGDGGDRIDWGRFAESLLQNSNPDYDPFLADDVRLVQSGADTILEYNVTAGTPQSALYQPLIIFKNTNAASLTPYNIGWKSYLPTIGGTAGNDVLTGTAGDDIIVGRAGADQISGLGGADVLRGQEGADQIDGGEGADRLEGGAGDDTLNGGNDDDYLDGGNGRDTVDGGAGNDQIRDQSGRDIIIAGAGNDIIDVFAYVDATAGSASGSVDAGDGDDIVNLRNNLGLEGYVINLGLGDDVLTLDRPVASLTLGAGRDTIVFKAPNRGVGQFVFSDFAAGDSGDVFDLNAYLEGVLRFSQGRILVSLGYNPFALGYVQLRQVGADVELFVYPDGLPDDDRYGLPAQVKFLGTTVAELTAANFGGYNPHVIPNYATLVSSDLTIAADEIRTMVNITPFLNLSASFVFRTGNSPDVVNNGELTSRLTQGGFGEIAGIYVVPGISSGGSFVNAASGRFIVESELPNVSELLRDWSYGLYTVSQSILFQNDGYFEVYSRESSAIGAQTGFDVFNNYPFINNGTFVVDAGEDAYGVRLGGSGNFVNNGDFFVFGAIYAVGIRFEDYRSGQFTNTGTISVGTHPDSPYNSIGILAYHGFNPSYVFDNSGIIIADIAFYSDDIAGLGPHADVLNNSGEIYGAVLMGNGADALVNSGLVSGPVWLGAGDDHYDGREGVLDGQVFGEAGKDALYGGDLADDLDGGDGDDILVGGGGGDTLEGGAGVDTASYRTAAQGVVLDFRTDSFAGDAIGDVFSSIEQFELSLQDDRFIGDGRADVVFALGGDDILDGGAGNDTLSGGDGSDVLIGGDGDDVLNGGAGIDVARVNGPRSAYTVTHLGAGSVRLTGPDGTELLSAVEIVQFDDTAEVVLLLDQAPSQVLAAYGASPSAGGWANANLFPRTVADVNGDGLGDIIGFGDDGVQVSLAKAEGGFNSAFSAISFFGASVAGGGWINANIYPRTAADVNGDGRADLVGFGDDGVFVALANANGTFAAPLGAINFFGASTAGGGWTNVNLYPRTAADVNGDGRADLIGFGDDGVFVSLANTDGTFAAPTFALGFFGASVAGGGWINADRYPRMAADVNGDGLADLIGFGDDGVFVALASGGGAFSAPAKVASTFGASAVGGGWTSNGLYPRMAADVNGDGRADLVGFGDGGVYVALSRGDGTFTGPLIELATFGAGAGAGGWSSNSLYPRLLADVTGDGRADIVAFGDGGVFVAKSLGNDILDILALPQRQAATGASHPAFEAAGTPSIDPDLYREAGTSWLNGPEFIV